MPSEYDATSYEPLFRAINKRFKEQFVDNEAAVTGTAPVVLYDNDMSTDTPDAVGNGTVASAFWCRLTVLPGESRIVEIGGNKTTHRIPGVAIVQFFGELGKGDRLLLEGVDRCKPYFSGRTSNLVRYRSPFIRRVGRSRGGNGRWWQMNLHIPFEADFIESTS